MEDAKVEDGDDDDDNHNVGGGDDDDDNEYTEDDIDNYDDEEYDNEDDDGDAVDMHQTRNVNDNIEVLRETLTDDDVEDIR